MNQYAPPIYLEMFYALFDGRVHVLTHVVTVSVLVLASALLALLVYPFTRRLLLPPPKDDFIAKRLPWRKLLGDGTTLLCERGGLTRIYAIAGVEAFLSDADHRMALVKARREAWNALAQHAPLITVVTARTKAPVPLPDGYKNPVIRKIMELYYAALTTTYRTTQAIIVTVPKPPSQEDANRILSDIHTTIQTKFRPFGPALMGPKAKNPDHRPLTFLAGLISPITRPRPAAVGEDAVCSMFQDRIAFAKRGGAFKVRNGPKRRYGWIISIKTPGERLDDNMILELGQLQAEAYISHILTPWHNGRRHEVRKALDTKRKRAAMGRSEAVELDINDAFDHVEKAVDGQVGEQVTLWDYNIVMTVLHESPTELERIVDSIHAIVAEYGGTAVREGSAAYAAWWSQWAEERTMQWPRIWLFNSEELSVLIPLEGAPLGTANCDWGPGPTIVLPTYGKSSYMFQFHVRGPNRTSRAAASAFVIGPTEAGKTTTLSILLGATTRFNNHRVFSTDRYDGLKIWTDAIGGRTVTFDENVSNVGLNPFDSEHSALNSTFLKSWLAGITDTASTSAEYAHIDQLVENSFKLLPDRRLRSLRACIAGGLLNPRSPVTPRIARWIDPKSIKGNLFNAQHDTLDLSDCIWTNLDLTHLYKDDDLASAVIPYLAYRIETSLAARKTTACIFLDEATPILKHPLMAEWFAIAHREHRKRGIAWISAFQDIPALADLGIMKLVEGGQVQTMFFLPNPAADAKQYAIFGLNEREFSFIKTGGWGLSHGMLIKRYAHSNRESVVVNTDFTALGAYLTLTANDDASKLRMFNAKDEAGHDWLDRYLNAA